MTPHDFINRVRARPWIGGLGALWILGTLTAFAEIRGVAVGVGILVLWSLAPPVVVVAIGHLGLLITHPETGSLVALVLVEAGMVAILAGPLATDYDPITTGTTLLATALGLAAITLAALAHTTAIWPAATVLVAAVAAAAYTLYRYERLQPAGMEGPT